MVMYETLARVMGPKSVLKIQCGRCGHAAAWPRRLAMRRLDPGGSPYDIRRRLRCGACGGKQLRAWVEP